MKGDKMGQSNWALLADSISDASVKHTVTEGIASPNNDGSDVYGFHSLTSAVAGVTGRYLNQSGFTPTGSGPGNADGGTSIRGALKRLASPGNTGFAPFYFVCCQDMPPSANSTAYMIGLGDSDPYEVVLAKGPLAGGLNPNAENVTILAKSSATFSMADDLWHHLRLDANVKGKGDVRLQVYQNDLTVNPIGQAPDWQAIEGIVDFVDDGLAINSGSLPLFGGCAGYAFYVDRALNRRAAFDAIEIGKI